LSKNNNFKIEKKAIFIIILTFIISSIIEIGIHFLFLKSSGIMIDYALWFLYLNISIAFLIGCTWHFITYKVKINCMTGMMIGMSLGMQAGMLIGGIVGITNGFFIGAMAGTLIGVGIGVWSGLHSKTTMGVLQGMMSGIMGGTMGSMITVMMFFDHLKFFMPIYMIINVAILVVMSYMFWQEAVKDNQEEYKKVPIDITTTIFVTIIVTIVLSAVILFLPRSAFLG
jgi:hypothetical protein